MKYPKLFSPLIVAAAMLLIFCTSCDEGPITNPGNETGTLHAAFEDFDSDNVTVMLDGDLVEIESNGYPNHESPYWSTSHALYVAPTVAQGMAPGNIDDWSGTYTLTVSASPEKATRSSSTNMGPIGIAVSGAMIYNDREAGNLPIGGNELASLDFNGAHTGPISYHYHLEPISISDDDDKLVGIMSDGFFMYGRKCNSTGDYPADLDASGGHSSITQHANESEYHYHIINEVYENQYYIIFAGDYQGTSNRIQW